MGKIGHNFQQDELPIPEGASVGPGWTEQMIEMADHIGAYRTLQLVEAFGGREIYIPADYQRGKLYDGIGAVADVVGQEGAQILSRIYGREYISVPLARHALSYARRQPVIASVREGELSVSEAARRLGTSRTYLSALVNQSDEGAIEGEERPRGRGRLAGQMDLFGEDSED